MISLETTRKGVAAEAALEKVTDVAARPKAVCPKTLREKTVAGVPLRTDADEKSSREESPVTTATSGTGAAVGLGLGVAARLAADFGFAGPCDDSYSLLSSNTDGAQDSYGELHGRNIFSFELSRADPLRRDDGVVSSGPMRAPEKLGALMGPPDFFGTAKGVAGPHGSSWEDGVRRTGISRVRFVRISVS